MKHEAEKAIEEARLAKESDNLDNPKVKSKALGVDQGKHEDGVGNTWATTKRRSCQRLDGGGRRWGGEEKDKNTVDAEYNKNTEDTVQGALFASEDVCMTKTPGR
jgi:hypothetical protein